MQKILRVPSRLACDMIIMGESSHHLVDNLVDLSGSVEPFEVLGDDVAIATHLWDVELK